MDEPITQRIARVVDEETQRASLVADKTRKANKKRYMVIGIILFVLGILSKIFDWSSVSEFGWLIAGLGAVLFLAVGIIL